MARPFSMTIRLTVASVRSVRFLRPERGLEIADRCAAAPAVARRRLVESRAFLLAGIEVGAERKAGLLRRLTKTRVSGCGAPLD